MREKAEEQVRCAVSIILPVALTTPQPRSPSILPVKQSYQRDLGVWGFYSRASEEFLVVSVVFTVLSLRKQRSTSSHRQVLRQINSIKFH